MKSIFGFAFRYKEHRVCCIWCDIPHNFIKIYVWEGKSMLAYLCGKRTLVGEMAMSVVLFWSVHQRNIDEKFLSGFEIEFFVDVWIVIFQRAFFDVCRFKNLFRGKTGNIVIEDFTFCFGQIRNPFKKESVPLRVDSIACPLREFVDFRLGAVICLFCRIPFFYQSCKVPVLWMKESPADCWFL